LRYVQHPSSVSALRAIHLLPQGEKGGPEPVRRSEEKAFVK
jgi:hypothetical protein